MLLCIENIDSDLTTATAIEDEGYESTRMWWIVADNATNRKRKRVSNHIDQLGKGHRKDGGKKEMVGRGVRRVEKERKKKRRKRLRIDSSTYVVVDGWMRYGKKRGG